MQPTTKENQAPQHNVQAEAPLPPARMTEISPPEYLPATGAAPEPTVEQEILALLLHHGCSVFRAHEMKQFFGHSRILFQECRDANWLPTRLSGNRFTGYHLADIVQCLRRLRREGRPPQAAKTPSHKNK